MDLDIRAIDVRMNDGLRDHLTRRLETAFDRFESRIQAVQARLVDVNGPKGGRDKRCHLAITGRGLERIRIQAVGESWRDAIDGAVERASRAVGRRIDARRKTRRSEARALRRRR